MVGEFSAAGWERRWHRCAWVLESCQPLETGMNGRRKRDGNGKTQRRKHDDTAVSGVLEIAARAPTSRCSTVTSPHRSSIPFSNTFSAS